MTYSATQSESTTLVVGWTNPSSQLIGWSDSDSGADVDDLKSTSAYVYTLARTAISWKSKKQTTMTVALSSIEVDYVVVAKEGIWIKSLLEEFKLFTIPTVTLFCDNQSCIELANNWKMSNNICHVALKHHFLCDLIETKKIELKFFPTHQMWVDFLTKSLQHSRHIVCCNQVGLIDVIEDKEEILYTFRYFCLGGGLWKIIHENK